MTCDDDTGFCLPIHHELDWQRKAKTKMTPNSEIGHRCVQSMCYSLFWEIKRQTACAASKERWTREVLLLARSFVVKKNFCWQEEVLRERSQERNVSQKLSQDTRRVRVSQREEDFDLHFLQSFSQVSFNFFFTKNNMNNLRQRQ